MQVILPFILVILSLVIVIIIIIRKYPQLLLLDIDTLPEVKESKKKDGIIRKKAEKESKHLYSRLAQFLQPLIKRSKELQLSFRKYIGRVEKNSRKQDSRTNKPETSEGKRQKKKAADNLVHEAQQDVDQDDFATAEKKYLVAIKQDPKNKEAYKGLASVYYEQDQKDEAKETYNFVLQLDKTDEDVYMKLGQIAEDEGEIEKAVDFYQETLMINSNNPSRFAKIFDLLFSIEQYDTALEAIEQALEIEPQNPKYLDNFVETSILLERKSLAEDGYSRLRMVNPDNQKLEVFRQRIDELK